MKTDSYFGRVRILVLP